jgi:thymidylate synthase
MKQYHDMIQRILDENPSKEFGKDRTGVGTISVVGHTMRFNLQDGFPAVTTKRLAWKSVVAELLWFLEGSTDERRLAEITYSKPRAELVDKTTIWTANADAQGKALGYLNNTERKELGPVYGAQWRNFGGVDQIINILDQIKNNPTSRRIILNAWNAGEVEQMALPPCHIMSQYIVKNGNLNCIMTQRSADSFLGIPFNIASYALLTHIFAREAGLGVGDLVINIGDAHLYSNSISGSEEMLSRTLLPLPILEISNMFNIERTLSGQTPLDAVNQFVLNDYSHHPEIKVEMAV